MAPATMNADRRITWRTERGPPYDSGSVFEHRMDVLTLQPGASVQRHELDEECERVHLATEPTHQIARGARGAARGEEIVHDEHALPGPDGILVHFEAIGPVFEIVRGPHGFRRQLPFLAHRREPRVDPIRDGGPEDEAAALDADDDVD